MKHYLIGFLLLFLLKINCYSQSLSQADLQGFTLNWEVIDNSLTGGRPSKSDFTILNNSGKSLPASGWKIYFNAGNFKSADTALAQIDLVNGDLLSLTPGSKFGKLQPGEQKKMIVTGGPIRNVTEYPLGFYLSFDNDPNKGYPLKLTIGNSVSTEKHDLAIANRIYRQNQQIKNIPTEQLPKIFPSPVSYRETKERFELDSTVAISAEMGFKTEANQLTSFITELIGKKPALKTAKSKKVIELLKIPGLGNEAYKLTVSRSKITISASTATGAFYGIQSLKSLIIPIGNGLHKTVTIAGVAVSDAPRFAHRAFMIDVGRNFHSKSEILKVLDLMALYKLNVFHFHFSEDEAWRLEITTLPELTQIGSKRAPTLDSKTHLTPSFGSGADTINSGTGHYTRSDFIEILKYAKDRHIKVIPEIESPGHARAAIKAMDARYERLMKAGQPEEAKKYLLRDPADKSQYRSVQGWDDNVINVAMPSVYTFMETVVDEIRAMYAEADAPLQTIHFGGDEVPGGVWENSPAVNALIKKEASVKTPNDLWSYYFGNLEAILKKKNLQLYGWEEAGLVKTLQNGKLVWVPNKALAKKNIQVDVWNNLIGSGAEDLAYRMANSGIKVVLTNVTNFYLDLAYNQSFNEPGLSWGGYVDIDKPFYFIPFNYLKNLKDNNGNPINKALIKGKEPLTEVGKSNIVGLQGALWSENIRNPERLEYMILPKFLGLAERAWAKEPAWAIENDPSKSEQLYQTAWSEFINVSGK
ncbi:MAG: beta-N-acetylhexosaminidase [Daejeonella sp.]|nr:beta-N-acetylhexosaminidase [Daejeonella sp.]